MKNIRIFIADDHAIVRTGLAALLDTEPGLEVVGEAADGAEAVRKVQKTHPDVVVMDLLMPVMDGMSATAEILKTQPKTKILILTTSGSRNDIALALRSGAVGALSKSTANETLVQAIKAAAAGQHPLSPEIQKLLEPEQPSADLTERQLATLEALAKGLSNSEIAKLLGIAEITVKNHVTGILAKLGATNRTEAATIAISRRLVKL